MMEIGRRNAPILWADGAPCFTTRKSGSLREYQRDAYLREYQRDAYLYIPELGGGRWQSRKTDREQSLQTTPSSMSLFRGKRIQTIATDRTH